jgi:hypothetical protein
MSLRPANKQQIVLCPVCNKETRNLPSHITQVMDRAHRQKSIELGYISDSRRPIEKSRITSEPARSYARNYGQ